MADQMYWKNRAVLVTGATGLVGSWLVKDLLALGAVVAVFVRDADPQSELLRSGDIQRTTVVNGSLEDFAAVRRAINETEAEVVFHLGAQPLVGKAARDPLQTFESNIRGAYHLLEACRQLSPLAQRVVIASSDKAYGEHPNLPYTEETPLQGRQPYEVSKSCADMLAQGYARSYLLPVAIARCGNIFGGGDLNWSRLVPGVIRSCLRGEAPVVRSNGRYVRDYVFVKDVTQAYILLAEKLDSLQLQGEAFNFSPERPLSVLEMVALVQKMMGCEKLVPEVRDEAAGEIVSQYLSCQKARRILNWRPAYTLEAGLEETIAWYKEFLKA